MPLLSCSRSIESTTFMAHLDWTWGSTVQALDASSRLRPNLCPCCKGTNLLARTAQPVKDDGGRRAHRKVVVCRRAPDRFEDHVGPLGDFGGQAPAGAETIRSGPGGSFILPGHEGKTRRAVS